MYKNYWLLFASLVFFSWSGIGFLYILLISILLNYIFGIQIQKNIDNKKSLRWLIIGVVTNVGILFVYKYTNFLVENLNNVLGFCSIPLVTQTNIILPIGISFYTFHSLSYIVDIYKRKTFAQRNILDLSLYITMFSQLIAGPIIRYSDVWQQLRNRTHASVKFVSGIERFVIGLGKKVLLANTFARIADEIFALDPSALGGANAWLGILCYTLQIYYDFAGYSDMAIGLGRMFGFEFMENFNFPYIARSIKDFWRRWHISLSSFFRDYVYISLGGNRVSIPKTYINLLIVFFLTGFWHGASWNFIVWGLLHGVFMVIERLGFEKTLAKAWAPISTLYTWIVVMFAWVLFRAETIEIAWDYWGQMFNFTSTLEQNSVFLNYIDLEFVIVFVIAIVGALGLFPYLEKKLTVLTQSKSKFANCITVNFHIGSALFYGAIIFMCTLYLISNSYNPFIYFRF